MKSYSQKDPGTGGPSQDSPQREISVVNVEITDQLALSLGPEIYNQILEVFVDQATDSVAKISRAVRFQCYDEIASLSHNMKGSASTLGCDLLAELYRMLELAAKDESPDKLVRLDAELQSATLESLNALSHSV